MDKVNKKIGDKITHYSVEFSKGMVVKSVEISEYTVIGSNEDKFVLDNASFTCIHHSKGKKEFYSTYLDKASIADYTRDDLMSKLLYHMRISVYSTMSKKRVENLISRELNKYIEGKIGEYGGWEDIKINFGG